MFKSAVCALMIALLLPAVAVEAKDRQVLDSPSQLYVKCTRAGTEEFDGRQCTAFRVAANKEVATCMGKGATDSQGYRALRLKCVALQRSRFFDPVE